MCTVNNHQILFASPLLTKEISVSAALMGSLLCVLSKDGTQEVKCSDAFIVDRLGLTGRTVCRVKKALIEKGYIIVSHHGKAEYGAIKPPMTLEAYVIHNLDDLDSKMEMLSSTLENVEPGEFSKKIPWMDNISFYKDKNRM